MITLLQWRDSLRYPNSASSRFCSSINRFRFILSSPFKQFIRKTHIRRSTILRGITKKTPPRLNLTLSRVGREVFRYYSSVFICPVVVLLQRRRCQSTNHHRLRDLEERKYQGCRSLRAQPSGHHLVVLEVPRNWTRVN